MSAPQIPTPPPAPARPQPVGQPVNPVDFFRRMPGGGTVYIRSSTPEHISGPVEALTYSEDRTARLAAAGRTNQRIAQELQVTVSTVEQHLTRAYRKLGISGRSGLAATLANTPKDPR